MQTRSCARELTEQILGEGIEVHRILATGLLESIYEEALAVERISLRPLCPLWQDPMADVRSTGAWNSGERLREGGPRTVRF
jgi:hypothetical protein